MLVRCSLFSLVPQCLARLERVLNPLLRLLLSAQGLESFPLQIQDVLLTHRSSRSDITSTQHAGDLSTEFDFVVRDEVPLPHEVDAHFESGQEVLSGRGDVGSRYRWFVSGAHKFES